jgi:hypothetical protein
MMRKIDLTPGANRVETGAVQFSDDWPGIFIRGDDAFRLLGILTPLQGVWTFQPDMNIFIDVLIKAIAEAHTSTNTS